MLALKTDMFEVQWALKECRGHLWEEGANQGKYDKWRGHLWEEDANQGKYDKWRGHLWEEGYKSGRIW